PLPGRRRRGQRAHRRLPPLPTRRSSDLSLYQQLLQGGLPAEFSPEPTLDDARQLLDWAVFYAETSFADSAANPRSTAPAKKISLARRVARRSIRTFPALEPVLRRVQKAL